MTAAVARSSHLKLDQQKTGSGKSTSTNVGTVNVSGTLRLAALRRAARLALRRTARLAVRRTARLALGGAVRLLALMRTFRLAGRLGRRVLQGQTGSQHSGGEQNRSDNGSSLHCSCSFSCLLEKCISLSCISNKLYGKTAVRGGGPRSYLYCWLTAAIPLLRYQALFLAPEGSSGLSKQWTVFRAAVC
ncbi:Piso0_002396 [Millerozyma farinosa CBS 7064]|uniref:Piso0_002396 protein n=1 Tax=Pichia sorbitophila (strain ATCC MYA-4447 / BCRC 22081 / CBS 7064 / NBRC 10061 / NRRL Y-12695) TaxID=559304 RepID=G8YEY1_PICSO|nr:Piso0_002396 [Millerozyma farinosa CBS 7064]